MPNQNLKAWQYRAYDMLAPNGSRRTLTFMPPQVPVGQTVSGTTTGMTVQSISVVLPQTTNQTWFYNPALATAQPGGDQTPPVAVEMYLINQSQTYSVSLTLSLVISTTQTVPATFVLRPNESFTIPTNTSAITAMAAGNTLNTLENTTITPLAGPTNPISLDFVTIV